MTAGPVLAAANWREFAPPQLTPILQGAMEALYEHGYHGTTVRDIARRAGVTVPALYYHYANKQGILVALLDLGIEDALGRARAALAEVGESAPARARFVAFVESMTLFMAHRVRMAVLDSELRYLEPANRRGYAAKRKELETLLLDILVDGNSSGVFRMTSPADTSRALLGMLRSITGWYHPDGPLTPTEISRRYVDIALSTVGAADPAAG
ncbi:transcriptional regulator, TetR family [Frankia torreyi]|uniref:Transcriptional regulator, TetR family n=1 Tax=Frankia torreyi TaxID=1856 RepID=A0A0D8BKG1_9ACTN|nr:MULTISPECIES: TetR/AcrR family transcriptional regulator [Frankia]KJE23882.1 transcriptional regulator, TetR family [Frankia torreyi]KQC39972.1 TetR family transcriptional regulator [Frankia sp. ACN1ag]KQM05791.1 transcriptional regulator, TetR family [Frankia sp. CpI1-P]